MLAKAEQRLFMKVVKEARIAWKRIIRAILVRKYINENYMDKL